MSLLHKLCHRTPSLVIAEDAAAGLAGTVESDFSHDLRQKTSISIVSSEDVDLVRWSDRDDRIFFSYGFTIFSCSDGNSSWLDIGFGFGGGLIWGFGISFN
ncbi:hypothetical protein TIFTF001_030266 [Ficus carica]|uniref:Uncharacterized protein n=1 Tax=Ficus carica TaxID=3494 RepID=A0AA88J2J2_FICCA|nr:hypothetical protein TIFTF001_030266 [Ficus carica]